MSLLIFNTLYYSFFYYSFFYYSSLICDISNIVLTLISFHKSICILASDIVIGTILFLNTRVITLVL